MTQKCFQIALFVKLLSSSLGICLEVTGVTTAKANSPVQESATRERRCMRDP